MTAIFMPPVTPEKQHLLDATKRALEISIEKAVAGNHIYEIGKAVEKYARKQGFQVIRELGGHGVGRHIHEKPSIPHYYNHQARGILQEGLVVTMEPFLSPTAKHIYKMPDGWTLKTRDGSLSAQFEHTIVITKGRPILVTQV